MKSNPSSIDPLIYRFIEEAGNTTQAFGMGRVLGQIYAYLYFSREPKNLNDLQHDLAISKGSASTIVRQLEQWQAVHKVWLEGDRKDHYQADLNFGRILKKVLHETVSAKMNTYNNLLDEMDETLHDCPNNGHDQEYIDFVRQRFNNLQAFHQRARKTWENPLTQKLLQ